MVDQELHEREELLLRLLGLEVDLLRELGEGVLAFQDEIVGVVRCVNGGDGVQDGGCQLLRVGLQKNTLEDLERRDIADSGPYAEK